MPKADTTAMPSKLPWSRGHHDVFQILLKNGAYVNAQGNNSGNTLQRKEATYSSASAYGDDS